MKYDIFVWISETRKYQFVLRSDEEDTNASTSVYNYDSSSSYKFK